MKQITVNNEVYNLPESWSEVYLEQFNNIQAISCDQKMRPPQKSIAILATLLKADKKVVGKIPSEYSSQIDISFLDKQIEKSVEKEIEIDGIKYVPMLDFKKQCIAETADLDYYLNKGVMENIHYMAAIIVRPLVNGKIEEYDNETLEERANIFKEKMNIVQLMTITGFFLSTENG